MVLWLWDSFIRSARFSLTGVPQKKGDHVDLKIVLRHFMGYAVGISIFLVLIPCVIWRLVSVDHPLFDIPVVAPDSLRYLLSGVLMIIGLVFVVWSNIFLFFKGEGGPTDIGGVRISPPTRALVVNGPYRHTRNPMVFGVHTIYMAMAIYLNSLVCLVALILFLWLVVRKYLILEEKRLLSDFGDDYHAYKAHTPMVMPRLWKKHLGDD